MLKEEILNTQEAAKLLGVTAARVRQLLLSGKLTGYKEEGHPNRTNWMISKESVLKYLEERSRSA